MAEAIISRRGQGAKKASLRTQVITVNGNFIVPNSINGAFDVMVFGGGGAGGGWYNSGAGGGGWMNNGTIDLVAGATIPITIGAGGARAPYSGEVGGTGGTTSFGIYLSANGGGGGYDNKGGSGGSGGGCVIGEGGDGYQFGGGGCCYGNGGNGGPWGGGGGCGGGIDVQYTSYGGKGGLYGGDGGNSPRLWVEGGRAGENGKDGTNTIGITAIPSNLRGYGKGGNAGAYYSGGYCSSSGGGGGYGGNGGNGGFIDFDWLQHGGGGGGGGYGPGAVGGCGGHSLNRNDWAANCNGGGGGGGYNCPGANCSWVETSGKSGGGGGYSPDLGSGGNWNQEGKPGVCIIQYYVAE